MTILIQPDALRELLAAGEPPLVADVRYTLATGPQRAEFEAGHLPGAQFVDLEAELTGPTSASTGRHPLPARDQFTEALGRLGLAPGRPVVVYDGGNALAASRLWWLLSDYGFDDVRVLDGGLPAWVAAGGELETGPAREPAPTLVEARPGHRDRVDGDGVRAALEAGSRVIDVRAAERFRGDVEPIDAVAGHIPGAENLPVGRLQDDAGRFVDAERRREVAGRIGPGDVLTCGSGITASLALLGLEDAGVRGARIYPGSWSEWIAQGRPVATGE